MGEIVLLLSKNLRSPLFIAFIAATPLIWYLSRQWLQNFAYQIDLGWWLWIVPGTAMLAIVFITISFQSIKAAIANPVKSLRTE
jgi:putative ABC transport system permease protein